MTRDDLIKWQKAFAKTYAKYPAEAQQAINETIKILQEPERKHGKWEDYGNYFSQCSLCRYPVSYFWGKTKFCPNCGAIMGGKNGEQE